MKEKQKEMRACIKSFDKEFISDEGKISQGLAYFLMTIVAFIMFVPYEFGKDDQMLLVSTGMFSLCVPLLYMMPYHIFRNNKMQYRVYEKMRYLPVRMHEIRMVRVGYLLRFLRIYVLAALAAQSIGAAHHYHRVPLENILYVLAVVGIFPFLVNVGMIWWHTRAE